MIAGLSERAAANLSTATLRRIQQMVAIKYTAGTEPAAASYAGSTQIQTVVRKGDHHEKTC